MKHKTMAALILIGMAVVFIGIILMMIGSMQEKDSNAKVAVGGFIPFGFTNDKKMLYAVIGISLAIFIISIILRWKHA